MRKFALFIFAGSAVLAACDQQTAIDANTAAANEAVANTDDATPASLGAPVDAETAKRLMHDRHENYEEMGDAMKLASRELKSDSPDLAQVRQAADTFATFAPQIPTWFPPGTGPDAGKTHAKAVVWEQPEDFLSKAGDFETAAKAFQAAAQGEDLEAIRAAHGDVGKSCKACHDTYRSKVD